MKKALFVATVVKTHIMAFHIPFLKMLKEIGYETAVAARNDYDNKNECNIPYCDEYFDAHFKRSPFSFANIKAYHQLKKIINNNHYDIIHCHTPVGGVLARLAAWGSRAKVIYTAHGFHFYKGAPLLNWLVYFPVEWVCAWLTDVLVTINQEDYIFAKKHMHAKQVVYIPGVGIDLDKFKSDVLDKQQRIQKRQVLGLTAEDKILLSVGELNKNKNHEIGIWALA
ncbi:MAG: glycosyltransferase, partial [Acidaminococcaceae bacterium]|nr:glycosyltransferase [Acidaminococcaceae bacterium]